MSSTRFCFLAMLGMCSFLRAAEAELGDFEAQADVGTVEPAGSAEFDKSAKQYRVKSSGENIWNKHDDFHFVYRNWPTSQLPPTSN